MCRKGFDADQRPVQVGHLNVAVSAILRRENSSARAEPGRELKGWV